MLANVYTAKTQFSDFLLRVEAGEVVQICRRNKPVAELRGLPKPRVTPRPIGLAKGLFTVPDSFFDPLPEDELAAWNGL